jgi:hypothetical protein
MEILDPQRFTRGVPVKNASALKPVMVRRLKGELRRHIGSQIPERKTIQIDITNLPADTPELVLAEKLSEYTEILEQKLSGQSNKAKGCGKLVTISLQKRLLSSVEAFARTLRVHRKNSATTLVATPPKHSDPPAALSLFKDESEEEDLADEEAAEIEDVEVARATRSGATAESDARARKLLDEMTSLAEASGGLGVADFETFDETREGVVLAVVLGEGGVTDEGESVHDDYPSKSARTASMAVASCLLIAFRRALSTTAWVVVPVVAQSKRS